MTTQEAKLKNDIPRTEKYYNYSELYFPDLRSNIFSIFTGDKPFIEKILKTKYDIIMELNQDYQGVKEHEQLSNDVPIQVEFTDDGLSISIIIKEENGEEKNMKIRMVQFCCLDWDKDVILLTILAKALNEIVLQCTRLIPKLINNRAVFKNINLIETNPVYEYMALVYAMYKMLHLTESLPGCYVQALMGRKRITYNMLCHTLKYNTKLPEQVKDWFSNTDIVKKQTYVTNRRQVLTNQTVSTLTNENDNLSTYEVTHWVLHLIDYTGQKFFQRLQFQYGPKRIYSDDRYVLIDADTEITG
ncbi:VP10 [Bercke-Baary Melophagus reo-like virus]|nr:VP10 [Bercke-Baary Melophagus reo-like virus]UJG27954.1 VP10 [Bercke-Baary Melophagus reo-like virus]